MEENIFRGKTIKDNTWVKGDLIISKDKYYIQPRANAFSVDESGLAKLVKVYEVYPESVGQYIGLDDKNGKQIFDGDIMGCYSEYRKEFDISVVKYGKFNCSCCHGIYGWNFECGDIREYSSYRVIGNKFDHGNILEMGGKLTPEQTTYILTHGDIDCESLNEKQKQAIELMKGKINEF